jgi:protein arginine N-methyltransferase 1
MSRPTGYRIITYGGMITDRPRIEPYVQALRQAVRPGCVVLDIGAGTGIFSLLACKLGASHVHAVEPNDSIELARMIAAANGFADRITFHQALSTEITLPRQADVIISDLRSILPLFERHVPVICDARERLLAPGGVLIPRRDTMWAALVDSAELYRPHAEPWLRNDFELNLEAGTPYVMNIWRKANASREQLLVPPQSWATLDYATIEQARVRGESTWTIEREGTAYGLLVWFDAELAEGIGFSNAPGDVQLIYGQAFFPLQAPVQLHAGDRVTVRLAADLTNDDYVWRWATDVQGAGELDKPRVSFRQSTFFGSHMAAARLDRRAASYVPELPVRGQVDQYLLSLIDGQTSLGEIARSVTERFPGYFSRWEDALARAGDLVERYR